jgi:thymidylate synthase (FAD)
VNIAESKVHLIACTFFHGTPTVDIPWQPMMDDADGDALAEFAGRACYQSWTRPNPETATNKGYIKNILQHQHYSVLEHGSATFYVTGVSRSLTHELVRHRHLSFSQLSQRYVDESDVAFVTPPALDRVGYRESLPLGQLATDIVQTYKKIVDVLIADGLSRKEARQAARAVLPNATETKIVVTGNYRAWREFIDKRATAAADVEIRALAVEICEQLQSIVPNIFQDYAVKPLDDGTEIVVKT